MPDTARFERLYGAVTNDLQAYIIEELDEGRLTNPEADWFADLIDGFHGEFQQWPSTTGPIREYLDRFDRPGVHRDLRLAAHVFLHIAYDLPRVIATTLDAQWPMRTSGRSVFIRPAPRFLKVFLTEMRRGRFGWLPRLAARWDAAQALGYWVIALRSVAFIHAEILVDAGPGLRSMLQDRMAEGLLEAGRTALERSWVLGIHGLDNSQLTSALPFGGALTPGQTLAAAAAAAGTGAIVVGIVAARRHRRLVGAIDVFGAAVHQRMSHAINPELGTPLQRI